MIVADLLGWWYLHGWTWCIKQVFLVQSEKIANFFSMSDLLKTLFSPFRQDSLQTKNAPVGIKLQLLAGNIISRFFGLIIRSMLVSVGVITLLLNTVVAVTMTLLWPFIPLLPLIAVGLWMTGVTL